MSANLEIHEKVFHLGESKVQKLASGAVRWLLAQNENVSLWVCDGQPGGKMNVGPSPDEVVLFVLDGVLIFDDGRVARDGEAIFQCPNTPYTGRYAGTEGLRFLSIHVVPLPGATPASKELMKGTIRLDDQKPTRRAVSGSLSWKVVETESTSVVIAENKPPLEIDDRGHPEAEIVYVIRGKVEYLNGRTVRPGEAVCNIRDLPHPLRYTGRDTIRIMEILSPPYGKPRPSGSVVQD